MRRQAAVAFLRALGRAGGEAPASAGSSCRLPAAAALLSRRGFADDASLLKTPLYEFHISNGGAAGGSAGCVTETCSGALLCDALLVQQCQAVDKQPWTQALNAARSVPVNNPCSQDGSVCRLVHAHSVQGELALRQAPLRRTAAISFQSTAPLAADFPHAGQQASVLLQALPLTQPSRASQRQWGPHASALTLLNASSSRAAGQHHGVDAALPAARLALRRLPHVRPEPQGAPLQAPACCPHTSRLPQQRKAATVAATTISNRPLHATA